MENNAEDQTIQGLAEARLQRANLIKEAGGVHIAISTGKIPHLIDITVSEAVVLGLLLQGVSKFISVLGHGTTEIGELLRIYQQAGLLHVFNVRNEIEASHAATALRWITGEKAVVVGSIGPGPLQALAASIVPLSNGLGVWYILGDETTEDEGPNFQQIPRPEQGSFHRLFSDMNHAYSLHTPLSLPTALRRGLNTVDHPHRAGPFYLLLPMNVQSIMLKGFNLDELPVGAPPPIGAAPDNGSYNQAALAILEAKKVLVRVGGGAKNAGKELIELLELSDGEAITAPVASGALPYNYSRNMSVAGSKGSISGNYAMDNADLLIVIGSRFVCQSDCSRTGYPNVQQVININTDIDSATHYGKTIAFVGDASATLQLLIKSLKELGAKPSDKSSAWFTACQEKKYEWNSYKLVRYKQETLFDPVWNKNVMTQPASIKIATDWAKENNCISIFDAGDVQANGFQIVEEDNPKQCITDGGSSYMGFASSAVLSSALSDNTYYPIAFTGDGSFMMNPQILIDAVEHRAEGCILILDNRRMAAISSLQMDQYGVDFATNDSVKVDYVAMASAIEGVNAMFGGYDSQSLVAALNLARKFKGLSVIHLPVYYGSDELGGLGTFGRWNVGVWSESTQKLRHEIGL